MVTPLVEVLARVGAGAEGRLCLLHQGFEIGSGFDGSRQLGSEHNDEFYMEDGNVRTRTNRRAPHLAAMFSLVVHWLCAIGLAKYCDHLVRLLWRHPGLLQGSELLHWKLSQCLWWPPSGGLPT